MMRQLSSLPFCCCSRIKQVVVRNTHFSSDTSAHLTKSWPPPQKKKIPYLIITLVWHALLKRDCFKWLFKEKTPLSSSFLKTDLIQLIHFSKTASDIFCVKSQYILALFDNGIYLLVTFSAINVQKMSQFLCCLINFFVDKLLEFN